MIAVDWGTTSFRAWRLAPDGTVLDRVAAERGILTVADGDFAGVLRAAIGPWLAAEPRVLIAGMAGSRQGWIEAPYLPCPAGAADLAARLTPVPFDGAVVRLIPGLAAEDEAGVPEVMRGEETQLVGADVADGLVCLPGSHSKWARMTGGTVAGFTTHLTGEAFAALRGHTILGRMMEDAPTDLVAFDRGVARAGQPGGLLHHLFGVRTLALAGRLDPAAGASYLSGLLIGHEVSAAAATLIGAPELCALYARAIAARGGAASIARPDAAARGIHRIGGLAAWT